MFRWINRIEGVTGCGRTAHIVRQLEMIGIRAPWLGIVELRQSRLRRLYDFVRSAIGSRHFTDRLLGKNGPEIGLLRSDQVTRCCEAKTVTEPEGFLKAQNCWFRNHFKQFESACRSSKRFSGSVTRRPWACR